MLQEDMRAYLDLLKQVLDHGERRTDRTGTGTLSLFGTQSRYDLREGFPLVTTKKVLFPAVVRELVWFLKGSTNINDDLHAHTPIWDAWADADGELGPIYGRQWRSWGGTGIDDRGLSPGGSGAEGMSQFFFHIFCDLKPFNKIAYFYFRNRFFSTR